ncbi:MAG: hypothetical protein HY300_13730 [Verrucomicrobia bacterium]|nr:hypothetical protein [Verrucomicrobiota bacterium]
MNAPVFSARRATVDDLEGLRVLWRAEHLPELDLEKRITEFQVAHDAENKVLGAIGLRVAGTQGGLHSETFSDFGLADTLRPLLWDRVQTVARNRGLTRLWTLEKTQFWRVAGFDAADEEVLKKFPAVFGASDMEWFTLKLKEDMLANLTPEQELALFRASAKESTEKMLDQARVLKWIAIVVGVLFFGLVSYFAFNLVRFMHRRNSGLAPSYLPPSRR